MLQDDVSDKADDSNINSSASGNQAGLPPQSNTPGQDLTGAPNPATAPSENAAFPIAPPGQIDLNADSNLNSELNFKQNSQPSDPSANRPADIPAASSNWEASTPVPETFAVPQSQEPTTTPQPQSASSNFQPPQANLAGPPQTESPPSINEQSPPAGSEGMDQVTPAAASAAVYTAPEVTRTSILSKIKTLIIILVIAGVVAGGILAAYFLFFKQNQEQTAKPDGQQEISPPQNVPSPAGQSVPTQTQEIPKSRFVVE